MSSESPRKSTRAGTARRKAPVIDSSDVEEENQSPQIKQEEEDDFTPAPLPAKRRGRPRKNADESATPKPTAPRRRPRATESVEPSQMFSPTSSVAEPQSAIKKEPTKRRTSTKPAPSARKPRVSAAATSVDGDSHLLTPEPTASPEPQPVQTPSTPLADITDSAVNERIPVPEPEPEPETEIQNTIIERTPVPEPETEIQNTIIEKPNARDPVFEKPMDILVRKRAAGLIVAPEPTVPKNRMVITYLILTNFKSYAGRQEVGPFHASFSSVVGPNGSGKSNVIDSLLFVFGFRASKMRQGKISALIHNSAAFPDLDHCEVEVHFQEVMDLPGGGTEVVPESTIVISRRAFKNNSSKYYINKRESTFTVVTSLLKDRGVDLDHKRFLILQGEVESIAQMKPKAASEHDDGLLEYLEDIIGTSKYKTPIEEAAAETETLNEVCTEKSNRVQHVEKEKSGLEEKKNKALAYLRDENELAIKRATLYQLYISEFDDHIQVTEESVNQLKAQLEEELAKHKGNEEGIESLDRQHAKGLKECGKLEKQTQEVLDQMSKFEKEALKFEERRKFLANKQKKSEKTKESSRHGISEAETTSKQCTDDIERCSEEIAELEQEMKVEEKELDALRASLAGKTQGLSDEIAEKQKSLEPWSAKINEKQSTIAVAQSELDILREKENSGAKNIAEVEAKIATLEASKEAKAAELDDCKNEKDRVEEEADNVQAQIDDLIKREPALQSKLSGARQKADEARASLSATQNQGNVLSGLMRLKDSGRINGFHGRLGNLGTIDQRYDVAISTACPQLENMVVDTVEVGQQCIDYLRKNNLGRANFILLDRLARRDLSQIDTPENAPRLFDLVKPKHDRFGPAFYSVLQNTLVAKDLEQANRIAYGAKRWRVVTLDGQLIDKSGTMSGGGTRVAKGGMSSKLASDVTKEQVVKLEQDRDALEQAFADIQQQHRELEMSLRQLRDQIPKLETKAQKLALELDSFDRNIADSQRRIEELSAEQSSTKSDKARISALEKSIASTEKEVAKLHAETADIEAEIKAIQDKIMEIGGVKLRSQNAKVALLKGRIDTLTDEASSAEISRSKVQKQKLKHEKSFADASKELEKLAVEIEKVEEDMEAQKRDVEGTRERAEEAQEALETRKEELQELKKELDERKAELQKTRGIEIEMRNKLEEGENNLGEFRRKQRAFQDKLGNLNYQSLSDIGEEQESDGIPTFTKDELQDIDRDDLKSEIASLEKKNENVSVDTSVLAEYRKRVEEHAARSQDLASAVAARDAARSRTNELRHLRLEGFMTGFSQISMRLKEMYQMITMGGNAELELVDSLDPFSEGILFSVMPPKKSWRNISNLSGGEKTLSSLALVFALHHYKPTPLYVMDEIDAALDFRNVSIVAAYIKERTKNAQFIVISLRNNMFELAARLVGVYKVNHMTKSVTIENKDYITGRA
ncbi:nuclear condensin-like protein complex subunit Smc4 [Aaosphaeria arxii CBS 175.79]|uniref:Structural maintenance of chromosomes protein n=1 Tax=Aaosphaeria arxii CBS 175.79 TaxID=1450172 RepID=A0A6A5XYP2_9PLEO|nr:nuclear condensin-like protein complex subunit Smc4 [Aaosphaeria arxii CBS 175.79]KAF2018435.1 nuclear condensin-like protein complex subunit Smc4 [Aaosphaeria arxii CBS 175.79]